jgi:hypothetical protein
MWISKAKWHMLKDNVEELGENVRQLIRLSRPNPPKVVCEYTVNTEKKLYIVKADSWTYNYASGFTEFYINSQCVAAIKNVISVSLP